MEITYIGPWVLLGIGALMILAALCITVFQKRTPSSLLLILGILSAGVGIHGPLFMGQYAVFLRTILQVVDNPDSESYSKLLDQIGQAKFDPELQEVALGYVLDRPVAGMDSLLATAINNANDLGRPALEKTKQAHVQRTEEAETKLQQLDWENLATAKKEIENFDPATRTRVSEKLLDPQFIESLNSDFGPQLEQLEELPLKDWVRPRETRVTMP